MSSRPKQTSFLAVLVYDDGGGRYSEEPHVITASHPEIAYRVALSRGAEQRYGRRFVGLAHLDEQDGEVELLAVSRGGDASEHVRAKEHLAAFCDPRWIGVEHSDEELAAALEEPPVLVALEGLEAIPWHQLTHAYGSATDVPIDLRRAASSDPEARAEAIWQLGGSIYHQGTLYPATSHAIPFLLRLATEPALPNRAELADLLSEIADSCTIDPAGIRKAWAWRKESFGEIYAAPTEELAEAEIRNCAAVRESMLAEVERLLLLADDADAGVAEHGRAILDRLGIAPTRA